MKLLDFKNDTFTLKSLKEKIIILDFWYSRCGICFTQFAKFQELKDFYNNDKDILLATVNIPYSKDSLYNPFEKLKMYSFYQLKGLGNTTTNYWQIKDGYPAYLVFDKNRNIRYTGILNYGTGVNSIKKIVETLKKE